MLHHIISNQSPKSKYTNVYRESTTSEPTETVTEVDTPPTSPVEPGGSLPQTATPLMLYLSSGAVLILLGIAGMKFIK